MTAAPRGGAMNRRARRALRANAKDTAALLSRRFYEYTAGGHMMRVTGPKVVALIADGFERLMRNDCRPCMSRISEEEAAAFPSWKPTSAGMVHAIAVGMDVAGYATCTQSAIAIDKATGQVDVAASTEAALTRALAELARHCSFSGFPLECLEHTGGRA
jgi:hypothetical protein